MTVADTMVRLHHFGAGGYRLAGTTHLGLGRQDAAELAECVEDLTRQQRETIRLDGTRTLGAILTELRERASLTRAELAQRVAARTGIVPETMRVLLWKWETGRVRSPDQYLLDSVMQELGYGLALVPLATREPDRG